GRPWARPPGGSRCGPWRSGRILTDLGDLALAVTREAVEILRQLGVELRDLFHALRLLPRVAVQDLALGPLRVVDLPDVGDRRLLRIGERALDDARLLVLLAEALHRELEGGLGSVRHDRVTSTISAVGSICRSNAGDQCPAGRPSWRSARASRI